MEQKVIVTGGAGAIGFHLTRALMDLGYEVFILDDLSSGTASLIDPRARFYEGSVTSDADLRHVFTEARPDYVLHVAALFANQNSVEHPEKDLSVNGMGTLKVLSHCQSYRVKKTLFFSSSCVYGAKSLMVEEENEFHPETPYAITKLLGERYCQFWARQYGLDVVIARIFNTFGPGEFPGKYRNVIPSFFELAMNQEALPITGTGEETRSFIYVEDTVRGALAALFAPTEPGEVFNIASPQETRIIDLAERINAMTGNRAGVKYVPRRSWDTVFRRQANVKKASERLNFKPEMSLGEGLERTYRWLQEYATKDSSNRLRISADLSSGSIPRRENPQPCL